MPSSQEIQDLLDRTRTYLQEKLLPFWIERSPDKIDGGFLTYFDRDGQQTGEDTKTFLMQVRMLYTMSSAHRSGYGGGQCAELAAMGARFIADHYWDHQYDGWFWIADRKGTPTVLDKIGYGQCFAIYAFSEYFLATGDSLGREMALETYGAVCRNMIDTRHGGYLELMTQDWRPFPPGRSGGDRKSLDVHMHMMEALTLFYEMTRSPTHRRRLLEVIDLITKRMLHPKNRLGWIHFTHDFQPLGRIIFETEWGRDADPADGASAPIDQTSPGHNVEFAWLLTHAVEILNLSPSDAHKLLKTQCDHCLLYGIDLHYGGVYADVPMSGPTTLTDKQFWQQAEVLVGMLDAFIHLEDEKYWLGFLNVYHYIFAHFVAENGGGEWYERLDRQGNPIDDALGHAWKISYHTVRSMIQTIKRLELLAGL